MTIVKNMTGSELNVAVQGRLDTSTAPQLEAELKNIPADVNRLVLDFEGLEYISSAGLRVLLQAMKMMKSRGSMVVRHVNETITEIFDVTGFCDILTIE